MSTDIPQKKTEPKSLQLTHYACKGLLAHIYHKNNLQIKHLPITDSCNFMKRFTIIATKTLTIRTICTKQHIWAKKKKNLLGLD